MTTISFPGLGINEFTIDPVAIPLGNAGIRWYALFIVTGMILALLYCSMRAKKEGIKVDTILDFAIFTIPIGIIGARLYYVLFDWIAAGSAGKPSPYQSFYDVIAIWEGGLAIYGGIIFGILTIVVIAKIKKMSWANFAKIADTAAPGVMIAQAIGRWGNFCNGEAYGSATSLPWRMCSDSFAFKLRAQGLIDSDTYYEMLEGTMGVHPTFLYESLWNILGFILINLVYKKKRFDGQITLMYITWYGFGRMFIELLRTDSLTTGGSLRISSLIGLLCFVIGGALLLVLFIKNKGNCAYTPVSANAAPTIENVTEENVSTEENDEEQTIDETSGDDTDSPPNEPENNIENTNTNEENSEENDNGKLN